MKEKQGQSFCLFSPSMDCHRLPPCSGSPHRHSYHRYLLFVSHCSVFTFSHSPRVGISPPSWPSSVLQPPILSPITVHIVNIDSISLFSFSLSLSALEREDNWGMSLRDHYLLLTLNISPNRWMGKAMLRIKARRYGGIPEKRLKVSFIL